MKFKSASSNPGVTSSNPQVKSSYPQFTSSNLWVPRDTSSNPRVANLNLRAMSTISQVTSLNWPIKGSNPQVQESLNQWKLTETAWRTT